MKKILTSLLVLLITLHLGYTTESIAQDMPNGPGNSDNNNNSPSGEIGNQGNDKPVGNAGGNNSPAIPIDGGLGILLAAGVGFGIKTFRNRKK